MRDTRALRAWSSLGGLLFVVLSSRVLPRWLGWFGIVAGVAALASIIFFTMLIWLVWIAVTSLLLFAHHRKTPTASPVAT